MEETNIFRCENCEWKRLMEVKNYDEDGVETTKEWVNVYVVDVPLGDLLVEYENLLSELSLKEENLMKVNEEWKQKKFHYRFISDIDFKELYGKSNDDIKKHHAEVECKDLLKERHDLELSIDYLKRYLPFLKEVIRSKV